VPGASCFIGYVTPHGTQSKAKGLVPETEHGNGSRSWSWNIGPGTQLGTGAVTIAANWRRRAFRL